MYWGQLSLRTGPGPVWTAAFALAFAVTLAAAVALAYAVFEDARALGSDHAYFWAFVSPVSPLLVVYVVLRRRLGPRGPPTDAERLARTVAASVFLAVLVAAFAPPDALTQTLWFWPSLAVAAPVSYYLFYRE